MTEALTIEEKLRILSGDGWWNTFAVKRLGIDAAKMCDGPHGLRRQEGGTGSLVNNAGEYAVCYPTESTVANSFDKKLLFETGKMLGREAASAGVDLVLGPGVNMKRSPLCGRNFEYYSEDPVLSGELAAAFINGIQSVGVGACVKHFACNNTEKRRLVSDSVVDARTLNEIYLKAFEIAVKKSRPLALMCSYNKINGKYMCEHKELITGTLRKKWGFRGIAISDWGAVSDMAASVKAGLDLEMPFGNGKGYEDLKKAYADGEIGVKEIDRAVKRVLNFVSICVRSRAKRSPSFDPIKADALALKAATESMVLLKNDGGVLPLSLNEKILVVGDAASVPHFQGAGSSRINVKKAVSVLDGLGSLGVQYDYMQGYSFGGESAALIGEVAAAAADYGTVLFVAGLAPGTEGEGYDRQNLELPDSVNALIGQTAHLFKKSAVLLFCGAPVVLPWLDKINALLYCGLPGQAGGSAAARILYGKECPCGKLAETWPQSVADTPSYSLAIASGNSVRYGEGVFIGYRHYEAKNIRPLFPFGYGLSYTSFSYGKITSNTLENGDFGITLEITNTGKVSGAETVMLFVKRPPDDLERPLKELLDFNKVFLKPSESREIRFTVTTESLKAFDSYGEKIIIGGGYEFIIASSSIAVCGTAHYNLPFEHLPFTMNSTLQDIVGCPQGKKLLESALFSGDNQMAKLSDGIKRSIFEMPIRGIGLLLPQVFTLEATEAMLHSLNGAALKEKV